MSESDRTSPLATASQRSTVLRVGGGAVGNSRVLARVRQELRGGRAALAEVGRILGSCWRASRVGRQFGAVRRQLGSAAATSGVSRLADGVERWAAASRLYRWAVADREPQFVVVELREARTVAPVIAAFDGGVRHGADGRVGSTAAAVADTVRETPIRAASVVGLAAVAVTLSLSIVFGTFGPAGIVVTTVLTVCCVLGLRIDASLAELRDSAPVRLLVAVTRPPEPPGRSDREDAAADDDPRNRT